jgi:hypothetical protein
MIFDFLLFFNLILKPFDVYCEDKNGVYNTRMPTSNSELYALHEGELLL